MKTDNDILKLQSISDLMGMNFYIPTYQRGYRWKTQQVTDLLNDIWEFYEKDKKPGEIYCVQPLVVKRKEEDTFRKIKEEARPLEEIENLLKGYWEVIDGQQRLTTFYIIFSYLLPDIQNKFQLEYATRNSENRVIGNPDDNMVGSKEFLGKLGRQEIKQELIESNIDFYHMYNTYLTVCEWFERKNEELHKKNEELNIGELIDVISNRVQFIWYETDEPDPIEVFTRLNIGKISLTNSELIKALFLNQSNYQGEADSIRLKQVEIATEWDEIEKNLRNEEFWLFIHEVGWDKPTRIEWIFDMISQKKVFGDMGDCGTDNHKTFRYFYEYFKRNKKSITSDWIKNTWNEVKKYFMILKEWYNDFELYHYIGFIVLIDSKNSKSKDDSKLRDLIDRYNDTKDNFKTFLKNEIKKKLRHTDLTYIYGEWGEKKTECFELLLLFNIQTVLNQNIEYIKSNKYGIGAYYRFPFHLFKKEAKKSSRKGWEVEHIASNSEDDLENPNNQKVWLASVLYSLRDDIAGSEGNKSLRKSIEAFLDNDNSSEEDFNNLKARIEELDVQPLNDDYKQMIWNFALLDSSTNEEYQNDPFPIKRICIISKDEGRKARKIFNPATHRVDFDKSEKVIAFVPPCTKNVFSKAYTNLPVSLTSWTPQDARCYLRKMEDVLCEFLYPDIFRLPERYRKTLFAKDRIIAFIPREVRTKYIELCDNKLDKDSKRHEEQQ